MKFRIKDIENEIKRIANKPEVDPNEFKDQIDITIKGLESKGICGKNVIIYDSMVKYLAETKLKVRSKGLLYFGNTGTGKTFALKVISAFRDIHFYTCEELEDKYDRSPEAFWELIRSNEDIIIDDLGTEATRSDYGVKFELMGKALSERHKAFERWGARTIISANLSGSAIKERYTERIYSRLKQMCECINATGEDLRII